MWFNLSALRRTVPPPPTRRDARLSDRVFGESGADFVENASLARRIQAAERAIVGVHETLHALQRVEDNGVFDFQNNLLRNRFVRRSRASARGAALFSRAVVRQQRCSTPFAYGSLRSQCGAKR
jgi:hypothetical protein